MVERERGALCGFVHLVQSEYLGVPAQVGEINFAVGRLPHRFVHLIEYLALEPVFETHEAQGCLNRVYFLSSDARSTLKNKEIEKDSSCEGKRKAIC